MIFAIWVFPLPHNPLVGDSNLSCPTLIIKQLKRKTLTAFLFFTQKSHTKSQQTTITKLKKIWSILWSKKIQNVKRGSFTYSKSLIFNIKTDYNQRTTTLMVAIFISFYYYKNLKKEKFYGIN